jgi:cysteine desulfurase
MNLVYADKNATTAVAPEVYEAMAPFLKGEYFNPSSMYEPARLTARAVSEARQKVAQFFNAAPKEILFTSSATESNNMAIFGTARANPHRRHVITTAVEHPAVFEVGKQMERDGYDVTFLPVDGDGNLDAGEFVRALPCSFGARVAVLGDNVRVSLEGRTYPIACPQSKQEPRCNE